MFRKKKVGLALGSGGALGLAHIGVLKVLEDNNIPVDMISGSSMGAVVASLYSAEPNSKKLIKIAKDLNWKKLFDYTISRKGFIKGNRIEKFLKENLEGMKFKDLKIPLYVPAFDINRNQEVIFHKGDVAKAVRASLSIPGIFVPVQNEGKVLVDGGVIDPIPIEILRRKGADIIIAVNVNHVDEKKPLIDVRASNRIGKGKVKNFFTNVARAMHVVESEVCDYELKTEKADFLIEPNLERYDGQDFTKYNGIIRAGEKAARKSLERLKKATEGNVFRDFLDSLKDNLDVTKIVKSPN